MKTVAKIAERAGLSPASALVDAVGMGMLTALIVAGFGLS